MKTFNLFCKLAAQSRSTVIVGVILFLALVIPMSLTTGKGMEQGFQKAEPQVIIVQADGEDPVATGLVAYLEKRTRVVAVEESKTAEERADDLFNRRADYILTIPQGFGQSFLEEREDVVLDKQVTEAVESEALVDTLIHNYLQSLRMELDFADGATIEERAEDALARMAGEPGTEIPVSISSTSYDVNMHIYGNYYLLYMCYVLLMMLLQIFGSVNITMEREALVKRNTLGNVGGMRHFLSTWAASLVLTLGLWVGFILVATLLLGPGTVWRSVGLSMTWASLLTTLGLHALAFFIASLLKKKGAVNFASNLVSLLVAFASGLFVPYEFVHPSLKQLAALAPPIWLVRSNRLMLDAVEMTAAKQATLWHYGRILVLLIVVYYLLTWVVKRRRYTAAK